MAVARVASWSDTHATSATTMTVTNSGSIPDDDVLVAFVGELVQGTITPPAGWTLIGTQDAGSNTRMSCYVKESSGEPGSWTWTIATATKCAAWVGEYSGVDFATVVGALASIASGTALACPAVSLLSNAWLLSAVVTRHTATGTASSFTGDAGDAERLDFGSNAGSGSDIGFAVYDSAGPLAGGVTLHTITAALTEGQIAGASVGLAPSGALPPATLANCVVGVHV